MSETARRIALLASPGPASERLRDALRSMGGNLVLDSDPSGLDIAELQAAEPQAVVVLLDPAVEDAIEAFDAVLSDPAIDVLYEEADLAVSREGWDVARWGRHLAAKLLHHGDVLPPRGKSDPENDSAVVSESTAQPVSAAIIAETSDDEAVATAEQVQTTSADTQVQVSEEFGGFDPVAAEYALEDDAPIEARTSASDALHSFTPDEPALVEQEADNASSTGFEPTTAEVEQPSIPAAGSDRNEVDLQSAIEELDPATNTEPVDSAQIDLVDFDETVKTSLEALSHEDAATAFENDAASPAVDTSLAAGSKRVHDLADLERRIATMELVATSESESEKEALSESESDSVSELSVSELSTPELSASESDRMPAQGGDSVSAQAGVVGGALLILAGIGGPDAVRQLLGKLPASFPRPVLVQQRLDGGRHDRLVQQMSRATELPVHLAESETIAEAGQIYILPPTLGVEVVDGRLHFAEGGNHLIASLPASDSAVLMLSGSEDSLVEAAMALAGEGAFVAGQSPEGCYDSAAATALVARGGQSGQPAELADRVLQFWSSRG